MDDKKKRKAPAELADEPDKFTCVATRMTIDTIDLKSGRVDRVSSSCSVEPWAFFMPPDAEGLFLPQTWQNPTLPDS